MPQPLSRPAIPDLFSVSFSLAAVVADGPAKFAKNVITWLIEKAVLVLVDSLNEVTGKKVDIALQAHDLFGEILDKLKGAPVSPPALMFKTLALLESQNALDWFLIARDPPDSDFTTVSSPPNFAFAVPADVTENPHFSLFNQASTDMATCGGYLDAMLNASQKYQGAILSGDTISAALQSDAFTEFSTESGKCARALSSDLKLLKNDFLGLDATAFSSYFQEIANIFSGQCGTTLSSDLNDILSSTGADQNTINSAVCKASTQLDPLIFQSDLALIFNPVIANLDEWANQYAPVTMVDEPEGMLLLLTSLWIFTILYQQRANLGLKIWIIKKQFVFPFGRLL